MNCRRAQSDIALWAGDDLDEAGLLSLKRHLEACPECRCYMQEMHLLMRLIDECPLREEGDNASKQAVEDSLWPALSTRLVTLSARRSDHFNGWIPAVSVAAVCLAMVLIASPPGMLAPQEAPLVSSTEEESWSTSQPSHPLSGPQAKWSADPVKTHPAFDFYQPDVSPRHPVERFFELDSIPPELLDPNSPFEFYVDRSNPMRPRIYMGLK